MSINLVDIILIIVVLLSAYNGYRRGFIYGLLDLLGWGLVLIAGLRFYQPIAKILSQLNLWSDVWDQPIGFVVIAIVVMLIYQSLALLLLRRMSKDVHEHKSNQVLGILPGLAYGTITSALIAALLLAFPINQTLHAQARESGLANRMAVYAERLEGALHPVFGEAVAETLNLLTVQPESHERVNLPYKVTQMRPRPDLEAGMLDLVNRERRTLGLQPLAPDPELTEVARKHSADMFARGYFAHDTPEGRNPFDRMRENGVRFSTAGENLALAPSLQVAHNGLMNSPGHRRNIMDPKFGRLGIGVMDGGLRGLMFTQNFRD
ncbi:MAG TPA: CvpA family protein [Pyrinomonadaceae bacterium]